MAACAKCGTALSDGAGFCPACGAPVAAAATAPPPVQPYAVAAQPRSGNTVLKVVLIVIAVVVGLGILGAATVGFLGYRAIHNAGGSFSMGTGAQVSTADLGIDPYPGAMHVDKGSVRMKIGGSLMVTSVFITSDSPEDLVKFYEDKIGPEVKVEQSAQGTTLQRGTEPGERGDSLLVTVTRNHDDGRTNIVIVHSNQNQPS